MNNFLWAILVLGIFEIGGMVAFLVAGKWPERTRGSIVYSIVFWLFFAVWAGMLLTSGAKS